MHLREHRAAAEFVAAKPFRQFVEITERKHWPYAGYERDTYLHTVDIPAEIEDIGLDYVTDIGHRRIALTHHGSPAKVHSPCGNLLQRVGDAQVCGRKAQCAAELFTRDHHSFKAVGIAQHRRGGRNFPFVEKSADFGRGYGVGAHYKRRDQFAAESLAAD